MIEKIWSHTGFEPCESQNYYVPARHPTNNEHEALATDIVFKPFINQTGILNTMSE